MFVQGGGAISLSTKKQTCIADSTMAFEFIALTSAAKEVALLRDLMFEIPILPMPISPVAIHTDCRKALAKAYGHVYNGQSRHITLRHNLVQGFIVNWVITLGCARIYR